MVNNEDSYSLLFPIKLGCLKLLVWINHQLRTEKEQTLSSPHSHHVFELRYVESGVCSMMINGTPLLFEKGTLILVRPGEYHYQMLPDKKNIGVQYSLRFSLEEPKNPEKSKEIRAYSVAMEILSNIRTVTSFPPDFPTLLSKLDYEMREQPIGYIHNVQLLSTIVLTDFFRSLGSDIISIFPDEEMQYKGQLITKMEQFFSRKYMQDVKIQDLANDINVSKRQAARILHQTYHMSFSQKLTEVRLQRAAYYLINSSFNMEDISKKCGFNNSSYFYMSFKKLYSLTPTEFRKSNQN